MRSLALTQLSQDVPVLRLQRVAVETQQAGPVEVFGDDRRPIERRLRLFIGHLQEQQICELLDVVAVAETVVTQDVAVVPEFLNDSVAGHGCSTVTGRFLALARALSYPPHVT